MNAMTESIPFNSDTLTKTALSDNSTDSWTSDVIAIKVMKGVVMFSIIFGALIGNALVIVSVAHFRNIRSVVTNYFILSLALADFLVALLVMPFNAIHNLSERWMFGRVVCDIFNANDVLFSTASLVHLCCISLDRYIAIMNPLAYQLTMTRRKVSGLLALCWIASLLISYIPVYTGIYTTSENLEQLEREPNLCRFIVNIYYGIISSTVSFWVPCLLMTVVYIRIFIEARKQEQKMYKLQKMTVIYTPPNNNTSVNSATAVVTSCADSNAHNDIDSAATPLKSDHCLTKTKTILSGGGTSGDKSSTSGGRNTLRREHKAAKTLGIIMGCFIICWLPFFVWYLVSSICDCFNKYDLLIDILFWIGYFNSTLNPIIYAFFNRDFRNAFRKLLQCKTS